MIRLQIALCALFTLSFAVGCGPQDADHSKAAPAKVEKVDELQLATVTLTEKANERLGIKTAEAQLIELPLKRVYGGEVVVPPGRAITVTAPVTGKIEAAEDPNAAALGRQVDRGHVVFRIAPLLSSERDVLTPAERVNVAVAKANLETLRIEAERRIEEEEIRVEAATIEHDRAVQLLDDKAGSQRSVDQAGAALKIAQENLATAKARHELFAAAALDTEPGQPVSLTITAPIAGILQNVPAASGDVVNAGTPLFDVVAQQSLWVRVPVYAGDRPNVAAVEAAAVNELGGQKDKAVLAVPVDAPPAADPLAATVDLVYALDNPEGRFIPGQKVEAAVAMQRPAQSLVVPWAAVLYDVHGGAWVYEQTAPQTYIRRRIEVEYVEQGQAVLSLGPPPKTKVVTDGAAELFGTEFGFGK